MKRIMILVLAACLLLALAGCAVVPSGKTEAKLYKGTLDTEFAELTLDVDVADISIEAGSAFKVEYGLGHEPVIETKDDGIISIHENAPDHWWENIHFSSANQPYVKVTVPAGASLSGIDVKVDVGNVKLADLTVEAFSIDCDVGDLEVRDVSAAFTAGMDVDVGNIDCRRVTVGAEVTFDTDTGDVYFDGSAAAINAESDVGNLEFLLPGAATDWAMELETDTGSVKINGKDQGKRMQLENPGGNLVLAAETDVGDIEVEFKG